jgi:muconolactone D-isomerase
LPGPPTGADAGAGELNGWLPVGEMCSIGLWRAANKAELEEKVLGSLPLRPWMTPAITEVEAHPNDPGKVDAGA